MSNAPPNLSVNRMPNKLRLLGSLRWCSGAGYLQRWSASRPETLWPNATDLSEEHHPRGSPHTTVLRLCSTAPHSSPLRPIPAKVPVFPNSWFSLCPVSLNRLEEGREYAFLNRCSKARTVFIKVSMFWSSTHFCLHRGGYQDSNLHLPSVEIYSRFYSRFHSRF